METNEAELFAEARQFKTPRQRIEFLHRVCPNDSTLRRRVESLLSVEDEADQFFLDATSMLAATVAESPPLVTNEDFLGTRIGRYQLIEKIGEGGCGVVYVAEQTQPVRRRVALKLIKLGMQTRSVVARFESERQLLALMDHPNIARVYDAGEADDGTPFFVMELVRGTKINDYCDRARLGVAQRVELVIQICHAIQHAHQKGVIHGDIKPSNILIELHEGVALPKVIDFGISKAIETDSSEYLFSTAPVEAAGTPAYMSPEQRGVGGVDVDTRSDIYSLGIVLYELLVGRTPSSQDTLLRSGFLTNGGVFEPPNLSPTEKMRGTDSARLRAIAEQRGTTPAQLLRQVGGDLDCIVAKAIEKDRSLRYATANALAADLQRHLKDEPVEAVPASWSYRLRKLVRRNRAVWAAGTAIALSLIAGMSASTFLFFKERESRQRAVAAEQQQTKLRHQAEAREKVMQAALLVNVEKFGEADKLAQELRVEQPMLESAAVFRALGEWHALHERWEKAADRFDMLLRIDDLDGMDVSTLDYLEQGPVLIELGDIDRYESFRGAAIRRFHDKGNPFSDRIVKISLLRPLDGNLIATLTPFVIQTEQARAASVAEGDSFQAAWRSLSLALWAYRTGDYNKAQELGRNCIESRDYNPPRLATARAILAMSALKLNHLDSARSHLEAGKEIEAKFRGRGDRGTPVAGFWFDCAFARILLREASVVIEDGGSREGAKSAK